MRPSIRLLSGGGKIPYPKHVWSPSGGWYAQPDNWKSNTAICAVVIAALTGMAWRLSAEREVRYRMPEPEAFFPSRHWSKQVIEYEKQQKAKGAVVEE